MIVVLTLVVVGCVSSDEADGGTFLEAVPSSQPTSSTVATIVPSVPPTTEVSTPATTTTTTSVPSFAEQYPEARKLDHNMWAVYVFVWEEDYSDPNHFVASGGEAAWEEVREHGATLGYTVTGLGDLACDLGAHELLGFEIRDRYTASALYFDDEADAVAVAEAFEPHTAGFGYVGIGCAD